MGILMDEDFDGDVDEIDMLMADDFYEELMAESEKHYQSVEFEDDDEDENSNFDEERSFIVFETPKQNKTSVDKTSKASRTNKANKNKTNVKKSTNKTPQVKKPKEYSCYDAHDKFMKDLIRAYPELDVNWDFDTDFEELIVEELEYDKQKAFKYMDYMFKKMFSKNRINIKNIKYLYQYLIINPFVSIIKNEHYKCYTKEVLEYVSSKTRLDYIFKDCDWGDLFDNDKVNTLNSVFEYFELCNNFDLAMYCYNMCREYQRKVFSDKLFGLFWKEKNLEFAKNKKVYNFYLKSITDLGVYGERSLIRLNKYLKDN